MPLAQAIYYPIHLDLLGFLKFKAFQIGCRQRIDDFLNYDLSEIIPLPIIYFMGAMQLFFASLRSRGA